MFSAPRPRLSKHLVYQINLQHFSQAPIFITLGQSANESRQSFECPLTICKHDIVEKVYHVLWLWCETLQSDSSKIRRDIIWVTSQTLFNILECSKFFISKSWAVSDEWWLNNISKVFFRMLFLFTFFCREFL